MVIFSLHGIGISLVNNLVGQEILHMGISSSGVIWQRKVNSRYRPYNIEANDALEKAYQEWIGNGRSEGFVNIDESEVNFSTLVLRLNKNASSEMKIRRSFHSGFHLIYRRSAHQTQIHMKLNHLQIDNQV
jgi:vacuolar protein sorting-associated protein 13A/C